MQPMTPALACDPRRSAVVEACAGSGKTWLLTARIARTLLEGGNPGGILALTFTNKAAEEMQARVWKELETLSRSTDAEAWEQCRKWGVPAERLAHCVEQAPHVFERLLLSPERPFVGTFHAWYLRLLASAPMGFARLARLSPSQRPSALRRLAFRRWSQQLSAADRAAFDWLHAELGSGRVLESLWQAVGWQRQVEAHSPGHWQQLIPQLDWAQALKENSADLARWVSSAQPLAAELAQAFGQLAPSRHKYAEALLQFGLPPAGPEPAGPEPAGPASFQALIDELFTDDKDAPAGRRQLRLKKTLVSAADRLAWGGRAGHYLGLLASLEAGLTGVQQRQAERTQQARQCTLMQLSEGLLRSFQTVSAAADETDFDGIESAVLELLRSPQGADLLARWDCRTEQILVDEFQDTSPAQWALLRAWLESHAGERRPEASAPKVFLVGDPKQSIYQFRGGDPRVFEAARLWLQQHYGAELLSADQTRRCGAEVVGLLNALMPSVMNTASAPQRFRAHDSLAESKPGGVFHLPLVRKAGGAGRTREAIPWLERDWLSEPRSQPSPSLHREEGLRIAAFLRQMHAEGMHPGGDGLRWQDMRVLVRARTHLVWIERAFAEAGIPFVSDRLGGLLEDPAVQDLIALCRLMVYPFSDQDCGHVLCSPLFGISPDALASVLVQARAQGAFLLEFLSDPARADERSPEWRSVGCRLGAWRQLASTLPIHDFLSHVVQDSGLLARLEQRLAWAQAAQVRANLMAFLQFSLQWEGGRLPSLSRFVHDLADRAEGDAEEQPAVGTPDQQWDAVKLQSLHAAKGLESELVVLASAAASERSDTSLRWLVQWTAQRDHIEALDAWLTRDWLSDAQMDRLSVQRAESEAESANLLYVAISRARRFFAVSGVEGGGSWYSAVSEHTRAWEPHADDTATG